MSWKIRVYALLSVVIFTACDDREFISEQATILEFESLEALSNEGENIVFIDLRPAAKFQTGHIPGAVQLWRTDLERTDLPYGGMAIEKSALAELMGSKGISTKDMLVVYDDKGNADAARLWWLLRRYGHARVKILNGGIHAWDNPLDTIRTQRPLQAFQFTESELPDMTIDFAEFEQLRKHPGVCVIDNRSREEFDGKVRKAGGFMAGHIPGSVNICYTNSIDLRDGAALKLKSIEELRQIYGAIAAPTDTVLLYCHSGVRSAHTYLVLTEVLGYQHVRNYDGSWMEWSYLKFGADVDSTALINQPL